MTISVLALLLPASRAAATAPGGNGRILDTRCHSAPSGQQCWVRVSNLDGIGTKTLTRGRHVIDTAIAWSPDGRRILFSRWTTRNGFAFRGLFTIDQNGENRKKITGVGPAAVFSPNGKRLAYMTDVGLWVVRSDGSRSRRIYEAEDHTLTAGIAWTSSNRIAFLSYRDYNTCGSIAQSDIWTIGPDGTDLTRVTDNDSSEAALDASPDGRRLMYTRFDCSQGGTRLYSIKLDGTDERLVTIDRTEDGPAVHSSDGRYVLMHDRPPRILTNTGELVRDVRAFGLWQPVLGTRRGRLRVNLSGGLDSSGGIQIKGRIPTKVTGIEVFAVLYRMQGGSWGRQDRLRTSSTRRGEFQGIVTNAPSAGRCRIVFYVPQTTEHRRIKEVRAFECRHPGRDARAGTKPATSSRQHALMGRWPTY